MGALPGDAGGHVTILVYGLWRVAGHLLDHLLRLTAGSVDQLRLGPRVERRRAARVPVAIDVELGGEVRAVHRALELSNGGLLLRCDGFYPVGGQVDLRFTLDVIEGLVPITVRGEVVNVRELDRGLGAGVRFLELPTEARAAIDGFVASSGAEMAGAAGAA